MGCMVTAKYAHFLVHCISAEQILVGIVGHLSSRRRHPSIVNLANTLEVKIDSNTAVKE